MTLLLLHAGATWAMAGLIWFVQVVHYPLFGLASESRFVSFAAEHQRRTSLVVVPLMLIELGTGVALVVMPPPGLGREILGLGLALLAVAWLSTAFVMVPLHRILSRGRNLSVIRRLVAHNWLRTAAWSGRAWLTFGLLAEAGR